MEKERRPETPFVYLDHQASTPLDPTVREAMLPWLAPDAAGNPHSGHRAGRRGADAIENARAQVASYLGAHASEIVFTSGATEANNLALFGLTQPGWSVLASTIEHPSVLNCLPALRESGRQCHVLEVDPVGLVQAEGLEGLIEPGKSLVSVIYANNEIGTVQDLDGLGKIIKKRDALFHSDATQGLLAGPIDVAALGLDALSLSGHKLYGPQGIGALYLRRGLEITARALGGGQERQRRSGTVPVALAVGLGAACDVAAARCREDSLRLTAAAERLFAEIKALWPAARRNGAARSIPGCLHVSLPGIDAADLLLDLPDLALATGSACATGYPGPSHVLRAIGLTDEEAYGSLRIGIGRFTTSHDLDAAACRLGRALQRRGRPGPT